MTEEKRKRLRRRLKVAGLILLCVLTIAATSVHLYDIGVRRTPLTLMYHLIEEEPTGPDSYLFVKPEAFEEQIRYLYEQGYDFLFSSQYAPVERLSVIITFDDGYDDNYLHALPILQKYGARATVFMITGNIGAPGYLTEDMIREMSESGTFEFGSHTENHRKLDTLDETQIREEFAASADRLRSLTGKKAETIAYPYGVYNDAVATLAKEYYNYIYTTKERTYFPIIRKDEIPRHTVFQGMTPEQFARMCRKR